MNQVDKITQQLFLNINKEIMEKIKGDDSEIDKKKGLLGQDEIKKIVS